MRGFKFKYSNGFDDIENVIILCIMLPKMSGYTASFNETKYIYIYICIYIYIHQKEQIIPKCFNNKTYLISIKQ